MTWILLFWEFFKTGLFALGGGLATIPFLYDLIDKYHWFTTEMLMNMIAISESTPGAMGVNMATYVGYYTTHSLLGGVITTLGLVLPSIIIICIVAQFLKKFKESKYVQNAFYGLRPAVCAMIASAGLSVFATTTFINGDWNINNFQYFPFILFLIGLAFTQRFKKLHPITIICIFAICGICFQL